MLFVSSVGKTGSLAALLGLLAAIPAAGQFVQDPPPEFSFLSAILKVRKNIPYEIWGEVRFPPNRDVGPARQGRHWSILAETANGSDPVTEWNRIKPAFLQNGWTVVKEYRVGGLLEVLQYAKNGVQAWANVDTDGSPLLFRVDVIEIAPPPFTLTLAAPARTPEKIERDKGDFPYLAPLPGSKFHRGDANNAPFRVTPPGAQEAEIVANGSLYRYYDFPELSNVLLTTVYHDAFTKGGWAIVQEGLSVIRAHYTQRGRNIWAMVDPTAGGYTLTVADAGLSDLGASLAKACHVALYGVLFDFNRSTLQPSSDAALQPAANIMTTDKTLRLEVQGHTDNVGNDSYNQTLSEARAKAVVTWLAQHGIAADRLTAKGYGKTKPVADNGSDEGRAKNRRVEIADPRCTPKSN
ncbi:MAG TPA: OmpA family protein [Bryobacteraceae bacterium]|nr:OmpA family protein [Bryobacteraceae bacterium]